MKRSKTRCRRGFTLIEVLLVLVILVVLASMSVPLYQTYQRQANKNAAKSQIGLFDTALETFSMNTNSYPTTEQGLEALITPPADLPDPNKWEGPYIKGEIPVDPWGNPYQYAYPGGRNPDSYDIWSLGPDMADGTEDDIGNWREY
ncbi:MAG: type II secretion system major pseudopilin GspG [Planctomycetota bacterium]